MKSAYTLLLAGLLAVSVVPTQAQAGSLLGGLLSGSHSSGGQSSGGGTSSGALGDLLGGGSLPVVGDVLGGGTVPVVGDLLGGGVSLPVDVGSLDVDVPGVVNLTTSSDGAGGSTVGVELLGGGGSSIGTNPLGLLGDGGGISVTLPGLIDVTPGDGGGGDGNGNGGGGNGGGSGGNGGDGGSGGNGGAGGNGGGSGGGSGSGNGSGGGDGGSSGSGGTVIIHHYANGGSGAGFVIPPGLSSRLKALLRILQERDYLRVSNGRAVCLNDFAVAEVAGWVPQKDWGKLQQALASYSQDIYTLRQLLANCRSATQRQALNLTSLNRVITLDIGADGRPVLFML